MERGRSVIPVKTIVKIFVDMGMMIMLLFLMTYEMIGQAAHEWLGIGIFGGQSFGRNLHMISAYGGFVLMSLHLGLHWSMLMGMVKKRVRNMNQTGTWMLRETGFFIAAYGAYAFEKRDIGTYMLMQSNSSDRTAHLLRSP